MARKLTEDEVRDSAKKILGLDNLSDGVRADVGQLTTFNELGFKGVSDKPDGWYLSENLNEPALIFEFKKSDTDISKQKCIDELLKNINIALTKYNKVAGILYNGNETIVYKNLEKIDAPRKLQNKDFYLALFKENKIDKQKIYNLTKQINDNLHFNFGIKNLNHRMIFTACALVAERYDGKLSKIKDMGYSTFHTSIHSTISKSYEDAIRQNSKLNHLLEVYASIRMNNPDNQQAVNDFIDNVVKISDSINSDFWNGEDVMAIFFNEFNRYKGKSERGQVFTPDHITSLMYHLIEVSKDDIVLDAACGSGSFLVKAMCNMIKEAGGTNTEKAKEIKRNQLFGIEFDKEIFALACANMLIHKDGKTNLEQLDTRSDEAAKWIKSKHATKVLMNPPFENKYGCIPIVRQVLDCVAKDTLCAFILPDKKLEKVAGAKKILDRHTLLKIVKLPEKVFAEGITTSIFIFKAGVPQGDKEIFACYIEDDGLETVKNQGRQDVRDRWEGIERQWLEIIRKQSGSETIQWLKPSEHLSYQMPKKEFEIYEEDFTKTVMDYLMFEEGIDVKEFQQRLINKVLYSSEISDRDGVVSINLKKEGDNEQN